MIIIKLQLTEEVYQEHEYISIIIYRLNVLLACANKLQNVVYYVDISFFMSKCTFILSSHLHIG